MFSPGFFDRGRRPSSLPCLSTCRSHDATSGEFSKDFDAGWEACRQTAFVPLIVVAAAGFVCGTLFVLWLGLLLPHGVGI